MNTILLKLFALLIWTAIGAHGSSIVLNTYGVYTAEVSRGFGTVGKGFTVINGDYQLQSITARLRDLSTTTVEDTMVVYLRRTSSVFIAGEPNTSPVRPGEIVSTFSWSPFPTTMTDVLFSPNSSVTLFEGESYIFEIGSNFAYGIPIAAHNYGDSYFGNENFALHDGGLWKAFTEPSYFPFNPDDPIGPAFLITATPIPEPSCLVLLVFAPLLFGLRRARANSSEADVASFNRKSRSIKII